MDEADFEGTLVLEKLAEIGAVDAFFEAIDSDNFDRAKSLLKKANVDNQSIAIVIRKMQEAEDSH